MSAAVTEIDFPRGGVPKLTRSAHNISKFGKGKAKPGQKAVSSANDPNSKSVHVDSNLPSYENVFRKILSTDLLVEDVRGLGIVKKINETDVILETAEGIQLELPANRISNRFTQMLSTGDTTLDEIFTVGQAIAFKVYDVAHLEENKKNGKTKPKVSTCPYEVNGHLLPLNFVSGLVVNGTIMSVEEKGAVVELGVLAKVTGFVQKDDLPSYMSLDALHVGQVVLFRVKSGTNATSRVINLTAFAEMDVFDDENFQLNHLMPGTILNVDPEKIVGDGVFVGLKNGMKGFVRKIHLPPRLRFDPSKCIKSFRVTVLCCQQNSPLLVLAAHPDTVALSKIEKRLLPVEYKIGEKVNCTVYEMDKQQNIYFRIDDDDTGNSSLLTAKALRIHIDDDERNTSSFSVGSQHTCRIIGYNSVERLLLVTKKASIINQKIITSSEAHPGEKFVATVVAIKPNGLTVKLGEDIFGSITTQHVKNKPSNNWEKGFRKDQRLACRVLYLDTETNRLILTAKAALVGSTDTIVNELDESLVGQVAVGSVIKVIDSGGLVVAFYNRVAGLVHASEAEKIKDVYLGMPIKVRINRVDVQRRLMFLDFGDDISSTPSNQSRIGQARTTIKKPAKPFRLYTAKVIGAWPYGGSSPDTTAELLLNGGSIGRLHASEINIEKYAEGSFPMKEFLSKHVGKTVTVKVICVGKPKNLSEKGRAKLMDEHQTTRIVECTLDEAKVNETRKKLKLINYETDFDYGSRVAVFVVSPEHSPLNSITLVSKTVLGEINPVFRVMISQHRINKVVLPPTKDSENTEDVCEEQFSSGELIYGKVVGVNKSRRGKYVELSLVNEEKKIKSKKRQLVLDDNLIDEKKDDILLLPTPATTPSRKRTKNESICSAEEPKPDVGELQSNISSPLNPPEKRQRFVKIQEPTFDWSLAGYTMDDFAEVGKKASTKASDAKRKQVANDKHDDEIRLTDEEQKLLGATGELDFNRLVTGNPNSSELWIKYIAFFISQKDYDKAKAIAERALDVISFKEDEEIFNIWKVYLNLEVMFGTEESLKQVFSRSCAGTNSLKMHKHLAKTLKNCSKNEEVVDVFESMLKKFRHEDLDVWYLYAEHFLEIGETVKARELLQRALQCLEKKHHVAILCRFAQMEYKHGDIERGKTMFEKIVHSYGKKTIVWTLFVDMVLKYESIVEARKIFERAITDNPLSGKLKIFFKKWMEAEEKFGDEESQSLVRERAAKVVDELKQEESVE